MPERRDFTIYRQAESGSPANGEGPEEALEPKESWEVRRCFCGSFDNQNIEDDNQQEEKKRDVDLVLHPGHEQQPQHKHALYEWIELLHQIATTVRICLGLPKNILLQEEPLHCHGNYDQDRPKAQERGDSMSSSSTPRTTASQVNATTRTETVDQDESNSSPGGNGGGSSSSSNDVCSVDLLRAFYYHTVSPPHGSKPCLGSSPHTDWGSFTVVWQDNVGGLETFCHACQTWNPVHPMTIRGTDNNDEDNNSDNNKNNETITTKDVPFTFVVHVSDITSLALRLAATNLVTTSTTMTPVQKQAAQRGTTIHLRDTQQQQQEPRDIDWSADWPSPRHRVVSPVQETRVSLVYFAYPPPDVTLAQVVESLQQQQAQRQEQQGGSFRVMKKEPPGNGDSSTERRTLALEDYSLLQNQSSTRNSNVHTTPLSPKDQLDRILHLPLREVLMDKWNQVQRTDD